MRLLADLWITSYTPGNDKSKALIFDAGPSAF